MSEDLCYQTVSELSGQIASGALSPVEVTEAYLERAQELDSKLASIITLLPDRALADARAAEEEIQQGRVRGPLHGIPSGSRTFSTPKESGQPGHPVSSPIAFRLVMPPWWKNSSARAAS